MRRSFSPTARLTAYFTLELVDEQPPSLPPPPVPPGHPDYGKSAIQLATEQSEIVVLVRVLAVSSTLSADETAILDTVSTQVETVLKSTPPGSLHVGDHLDLSSSHDDVLRGVIEFLGYDPRPEPSAIGERITFWRTARGLSQEEMARRLGVDPSTLAKWESGRRVPRGPWRDAALRDDYYRTVTFRPVNAY